MSSVAKLFLNLKKGGTPIPGESDNVGYEDQIEIEDWSWSLSRSSASGSHGPDKAEPSVLSFSKFTDRATTAMLAAAKSGDELSAVFTLDDQSEGEFKLILTLDKVRIIKFDMNLHLERTEATIEENWEFNYQSISFAYTPRAKGKGAPAGAISTKIDRHPSASTQSPEHWGCDMIDLAGKISTAGFDKLLPQLRHTSPLFDARAMAAPAQARMPN
jgi:type VI protein secretion system component Hcp